MTALPQQLKPLLLRAEADGRLLLVLQNELSILEFIHNLVETLDKYYENVCELDVSHATLTALQPPGLAICSSVVLTCCWC